MTPAIYEALHRRHKAPEWALLTEVAQGTGGMGGRSADAIAMNLYPSRGLSVHGYEVKASRGDWLRELAQPDKSEPIQRYCDHWWIATLPGVVKDGELPPTWGLLEVKGGVLRQMVKAPKLPAQPMPRTFLASLLRRATEAHARDVAAKAKMTVEDMRKNLTAQMEARVRERTRDNSYVAERVEKLEKLLDADLRTYFDAEGFLAAVKLVQKLGVEGTYSVIGGYVHSARRLIAMHDEMGGDRGGANDPQEA